MGPFPEFRRTLTWYSQQRMFLVFNLYIKFVQFLSAFFQIDIPLRLVFLLSSLLKWECNKHADWPGYQSRQNVPTSHSWHKPPFSWGVKREGCPSKGLRHFWIQICILGTQNNTWGWTRKKKRSCLVSVCDICLGEESAELIGNPIVETLTSQL